MVSEVFNMDCVDYENFLKDKTKKTLNSGFDIDESELNNNLFPFQKFCVKRALRKGKYALFESCGLGKTIQQLEWAYQVSKHTNKPVIILAPLSVSLQTIDEGLKFGIDVKKYDGSDFPIQITNYEQLDNIDCSKFGGVVLDESSILKSFNGATKRKIIDSFSQTPYKLACTATPSPNDPMELGNHAEFLDVMSYNEMLSMYFIHDGGNTSKWKLKGHATESFYKFVGSWSVMFSTPSEIGFSDDGYILPHLNYIEEQIVTPKRDNGKLFNDSAVNATNFNQELRDTTELRLKRVADIVNSHKDEPFIVWIKQNQEGEKLKKKGYILKME